MKLMKFVSQILNNVLDPSPTLVLNSTTDLDKMILVYLVMEKSSLMKEKTTTKNGLKPVWIAQEDTHWKIN